jgi:hypothetical protein
MLCAAIANTSRISEMSMRCAALVEVGTRRRVTCSGVQRRHYRVCSAWNLGSIAAAWPATKEFLHRGPNAMRRQAPR